MSKKREMLKIICAETMVWAAVAIDQGLIHTYVNALPLDDSSLKMGVRLMVAIVHSIESHGAEFSPKVRQQCALTHSMLAKLVKELD
jgi:hypothetical protein